jgi:hypothetical protein
LPPLTRLLLRTSGEGFAELEYGAHVTLLTACQHRADCLNSTACAARRHAAPHGRHHSRDAGGH